MFKPLVNDDVVLKCYFQKKKYCTFIYYVDIITRTNGLQGVPINMGIA